MYSILASLPLEDASEYINKINTRAVLIVIALGLLTLVTAIYTGVAVEDQSAPSALMGCLSTLVGICLTGFGIYNLVQLKNTRDHLTDGLVVDFDHTNWQRFTTASAIVFIVITLGLLVLCVSFVFQSEAQAVVNTFIFAVITAVVFIGTSWLDASIDAYADAILAPIAQ